jgi:Cu-processing system permease protein
VKGASIVMRYTLLECVRRKVFIVVPIATALFLGLYALANHYAFDFSENTSVGPARFVDAQTLTGATLVGLSMFATLFLSSVLGVFLTFNAVRGDAETGVLQGIVVRPPGRVSFFLGRFAGASLVAVVYALVLFFASVAITSIIGGWSPTQPVLAGVSIAAGAIVMTALSLAGSIFLSTIANGITVFMLYGGGLVAGLLGQVGVAIGSPNLQRIGKIGAWALPFEALYQSGLATLTAGTSGLTRFVVQLGPLGGAESAGPILVPYVIAYLFIVGAIASYFFVRRDL